MRLASLGIRTRLLLFGILPAAAILAAVLIMNYLRMRSLLLGFGEEIVRDRAQVVAADIERDTLEAVATARTMALAVENGLLGRRFDALRFARGVLEAHPQFTGAYIGLEPDADGLDAESAVSGTSAAAEVAAPAAPADQASPETADSASSPSASGSSPM